MITWIRTANTRSGKGAAATAWALRVSAYVNEVFGTNLTVHTNVGGPINQLRWVATYDSLAEFEDVSTRILEDPGYQELIAESSTQQFFDSPTIADMIYRKIG